MTDEEQTTIDGKPAPAARTRNALGAAHLYALGQWLNKADVAKFDSVAEMAAHASNELTFLVTERNVSTMLTITGRAADYVSGAARRAEAAKKMAAAQKAGPRLLAALKAAMTYADFPNDEPGNAAYTEAQAAIAEAEGGE